MLYKIVIFLFHSKEKTKYLSLWDCVGKAFSLVIFLTLNRWKIHTKWLVRTGHNKTNWKSFVSVCIRWFGHKTQVIGFVLAAGYMPLKAFIAIYINIILFYLFFSFEACKRTSFSRSTSTKMHSTRNAILFKSN